MYRIKWPIRGINLRRVLSLRRGFLAVVAVCMIAVAATAVYVRYGQSPQDIPERPMLPEETDLLKQPVISGEQLEGDQLEPAKTTVSEKKPEEQKAGQAAKPVKLTAKPAAPEANIKTMIMPVMGRVIKGFAADRLVYSETLKHWETHEGLDIKGEIGAAVKASLAGTVEKVCDDLRLGQTVVLDHGNGYKTLYGNLNPKVLVKEGAAVKKGDVIGSIGDTAGFESADPPHLHFEVYYGETRVDPCIYLPKIE